MSELLLLFDLDDTLLVSPDPLLGQAMATALNEQTGAELPDDAIEQVEHAGRTARSIARMLLRRFGVLTTPDMREWCRLTEEHYAVLLADADTSGWRIAEGAEAALERLASRHRLALLTGNPQGVARARLERLGLDRFFPEGQGAFGCESEDRVELIDRARARASDWPAESTVSVGNAPFDAMTASAAGIRSIRLGPDGDARSFAEIAAQLVGEPEPAGPQLEDLTAEDWESVAAIYEEGLEAGTFESEVPRWEAWDESHLEAPRLVARLNGAVVGWAALVPTSGREVYCGVADDSVYVAASARGQGVGRMLLAELVRRAEDAGIWTVQASCFTENAASIALHEQCGFRVVGTRERIAKKDGEWRDTVLLERRSPAVE